MRRRRARPVPVLLAALLAAAALAPSGPSVAAPHPTGSVGAGSGPGSDDGWRVQRDGAGGFRVTLRLEEPVPVTGARPEVLVDGVPVGPGLVSDDGLTVRLAGSLATRPDVSDLDVTLSGRPLGSGPATPGPSGADAPEPPAPGPLLGVDPAEPGSDDVAVDDYELDPITADGLPDVETVGHVEGPVGAGSVPVVVLLHGRHAPCYLDADTFGAQDWPCGSGQEPVPSQLGFTYVQDVLASQGFLTVSVAANGISAQDGDVLDGGAQARADLVEHHLRLLADGDLDEFLPAGTTADLSQVVLVGHSRGAEGMNRLAESDPPGGDLEVVGQVLLAATDLFRQAAPYVPSVTVLPYCDGDVVDLQGQQYTDVPRDLVRDDPALHSTVLMMGANHKYFNTEWTPGLSAAPSEDDGTQYGGYCSSGGDTRFSAGEQQDAGLVYIAGAVRLFTGEDDLAPLFDGTQARAATTADLDIRSHATGALRDVVRPGQGSTAVGDADVAVCSGFAEVCLPSDARYTSPHFGSWRFDGDVPVRPALRIGWSAVGQTAGLRLADSIDVADDAHLDLRVVLPVGADEAAFDVDLTDDDGDTTRVTPVDGGRVAALPRRSTGAAVAQVLRVDLDGLDGTDALDLDALQGVSLVTGTAAGTAWLLDAAGVPGALPDPGTGHAPALDLAQRVVVPEGDDPDGTVSVPYTLDAPAPAGSRIRALQVDAGRGHIPDDTIDVDIPAGATEGTVELPLRGDDVHGGRSRVTMVVLPVSGVAPADSDTVIVVQEDDPRPSIVSLEPRRQTVREGDVVRADGELTGPLGPGRIRAHLVRGAGPVLRVGDLTRRYLTQLGMLHRDPSDPAVGTDFPIPVAFVGRSETHFSLRLRIARDGVREGPEHVTIRVQNLGHRTVTATIRD